MRSFTGALNGIGDALTFIIVLAAMIAFLVTLILFSLSAMACAYLLRGALYRLRRREMAETVFEDIRRRTLFGSEIYSGGSNGI